MLGIEHMLLECALLRNNHEEYYTSDSLKALFETISETCIVELLQEAGFFYLIWRYLQFLTGIIPELFFNFNYPTGLKNIIRLD